MPKKEAPKDGAPVVAPPTVIESLKRLYNHKVKPLESMYRFSDFHSASLTSSDFDAKPMVLLLGQYSVGKTSFIRYLLGQDFPNQRIGPEPTTDRFVSVMYGPHRRVIPGNALCASADMPFRALNKFGTSFLNKFEASILPAEILEKVYFVDTPGVLSGEKQRIGRSYDFVEVVEWFAERADMILLLFDAHKLDISDEFKRAIEALRGQDDKVRVVLNKADKVTYQQLMRVYGALMWSLGKVTRTPEVMRVYIGSFWDKPYHNKDNKKLFDAERRDLLNDLRSLPRNAAVRKINEMVKRARLAKVHAYILAHLRSQMPTLWGKDSKQKELLADLPNVFFTIHKAKRIPVGDFPQVARMRQLLEHEDFKKFPKLNQRVIDQMDEVLSQDIPRLMKQLGQETFVKGLDVDGPDVTGGGGAGGGAGAGVGGSVTMGGVVMGTAPPDDDLGLPVPSIAGGGASVRSFDQAEIRARLTAFYKRVNPSHVNNVERIIAKYQGRFEKLFEELEARYGYAEELSGEDPVAGTSPSASGYGYGGGASSAPPPVPSRPSAPSVTKAPAPPAPAVAAAAPAPAPAPAPAAPVSASVANPFDDFDDEPEDAGKPWALEGDKATYGAIFQSLNPQNGKLSGGDCKQTLMDSGLPKGSLRKIWSLADVDKDGYLDLEEFCIAMHLITTAQAGEELPDALEEDMVPPSKR